MSEPGRLCLTGFDEAQIRVFVSDLYRIFHAREPDSVGLDFYTDGLKGGAPVADMIAVFLNSDEFTEHRRRAVMAELARSDFCAKPTDTRADKESSWAPVSGWFPEDYTPPGEAGRSYLRRVRSGFFDRYCSGPIVLDVGYIGYDNPEKKPALPNAIGIDLDYPGYYGLDLPFDDGTVDTVFSSHCLEHILYEHATIRDWMRVLKVGGFIVCVVPSQALYEKRRFLPSRFNSDHKRMYTPASLARSFEEALEVNTYRVRHLAENDCGFNYALGPETHSDGAYEIEIVIEKIARPDWVLA